MKILQRGFRLGLALSLCALSGLLFSYPPIASAQNPVYYVAVEGSDRAGNGAHYAPWATITHALRQVPDGSTVLVRPGLYQGHVRLEGTFSLGVIVRSEVPYQARLRYDGTVVTCFTGQGITLEGFDIAHGGPDAGQYVIQIQDLIKDDGISGGTNYVSRITLRDNIIHDSYNNDLLKINNGAGIVIVENNVFYNQEGHDEHIDVNSATDVLIQDNIFFNDFAGSGRENNNDTASYIVIKDSNGPDDSNLGSQRIRVRRNVFLNWEGSDGNNFLVVGEDGHPYYEAQDVLVENNLLIGNTGNVIRAAFGVKGAKDVVFRNNTIVGDLPSLAFAMRLNTQGNNQRNEGIRFYNNIWSDPTGTMGAERASRPVDFTDTPPDQTNTFVLDHNLYWNGGRLLPLDTDELVNISDDPHALVGDPLLGQQTFVWLPRWIPEYGRFGDGSTTIRQAFVRLVLYYGKPRIGSLALNAAHPEHAPPDDILGQPRPAGPGPDLGAFERQVRPLSGGDSARPVTSTVR